MKIILMLKTVELLGRNNQNFTKMLYSGLRGTSVGYTFNCFDQTVQQFLALELFS